MILKNSPLKNRDAYIDDWIQRYLEPELQKLDKRKQHCAGQDYARHRDFSFILPFYIAPDLRRIAPFAIEMHNACTYAEKILFYMLDRLPRFGGIAMDAIGSGETWLNMLPNDTVSIWCIKLS